MGGGSRGRGATQRAWLMALSVGAGSMALSGSSAAQEIAGPPLGGGTAVVETGPAAAQIEDPERRPIGRGEVSGREGAPLGASGPKGEARATSGGLGAARTVLSLGLVLGLAVAAAAVVKRVARAQGGLAGSVGAGGAAPAGIMEIIGRYPIARGQKLVLLRLDRRVLLLSHVAPSRLSRGGGFSTLCEITDADEVASILTKARDAEGESLAAKFQSMLGRYGHAGDEEGADADEDPPELRTVKLAPDGDRAELWNDRPMRLVAAEGVRSAGPAEGDAVSAIRRRLEAMRGGAGGRA